MGFHTSGRNSGVLHSGIYYQPDSLKAKLCVEGAKRLKEWVKERSLPINECGKVIVPQDEHLDSQIDLLYKRGGSYERIGNYEKSDIDLLAALKIIPDNISADNASIFLIGFFSNLIFFFKWLH